MSAREEFIELFTTHIHRGGQRGPAGIIFRIRATFSPPLRRPNSTGPYVGGLCDHSVNVYHCLREYLERERVKELYGLEYGEGEHRHRRPAPRRVQDRLL